MTSTTDTDESELLLKSDRLDVCAWLGRGANRYWTAFESSGMSGQAFCAKLASILGPFASWVQKRRGAVALIQTEGGQIREGSLGSGRGDHGDEPV